MAIDLPDTHTWVDGETPDAALMNAHVAAAVALLRSPPTASLRRAASQSVANNTFTAVEWDTADESTDGMWDSESDQTRLTVTTPGLYLLSCSVGWAGNATGFRSARWMKNGTPILYHTRLYPGNSGAVSMAGPTVVARAANGDYFELGVQQTSGGALNLSNASPDGTQACALWVGV